MLEHWDQEVRAECGNLQLYTADATPGAQKAAAVHSLLPAAAWGHRQQSTADRHHPGRLHTRVPWAALAYHASGNLHQLQVRLHVLAAGALTLLKKNEH